MSIHRCEVAIDDAPERVQLRARELGAVRLEVQAGNGFAWFVLFGADGAELDEVSPDDDEEDGDGEAECDEWHDWAVNS